MFLENCIVIDRSRWNSMKRADFNFYDYIIIREDCEIDESPTFTYSIIKSRYDGKLYKGLSEYQLNEHMNDIVLGIFDK